MHAMFAWDVPRISRTVGVLIVCCWHVQRQRGSVMHCLFARLIPKQHRTIELQSLPCRIIQWQRAVDVLGLFSRYIQQWKFTCSLPASAPRKHQHSAVELSVYRLPR